MTKYYRFHIERDIEPFPHVPIRSRKQARAVAEWIANQTFARVHYYRDDTLTPDNLLAWTKDAKPHPLEDAPSDE